MEDHAAIRHHWAVGKPLFSHSFGDSLLSGQVVHYKPWKPYLVSRNFVVYVVIVIIIITIYKKFSEVIVHSQDCRLKDMTLLSLYLVAERITTLSKLI